MRASAVTADVDDTPAVALRICEDHVVRRGGALVPMKSALVGCPHARIERLSPIWERGHARSRSSRACQLPLPIREPLTLHVLLEEGSRSARLGALGRRLEIHAMHGPAFGECMDESRRSHLPAPHQSERQRIKRMGQLTCQSPRPRPHGSCRADDAEAQLPFGTASSRHGKPISTVTASAGPRRSRAAKPRRCDA
jgi:hypothetical protein